MLRQKSILFTPIKIGNTLIPNRFMRSATYEGRADKKGYPKPSLLKMIKTLALNEVGLIVPGFVYPSKKGQVVSDQTGMYSPSHAEAWKTTINEIHRDTKSKIIFQICHGGAESPPELIDGIPDAPSSIKPNTHRLTIPEIQQVIQSFVDAAVSLKKVGADGVQLHCAHGFLLSSFLSPALNRRHDDYGGSLENRVRIVKEIATEIRKATGPDFLISAKINSDDYDEDSDGGVTPSICSWYISQLPMIDMFEISAGVGQKAYGSRIKFDRKLYQKMISPPEDSLHSIKVANSDSSGVPFFEGYNVESTMTIRKLVPKAKLAVVGGLRKFENLEKIVNAKIADIISLSRPFLREPDLVKKFKNSAVESKCISCGLCIYGNKGVKCYYP